jgi:trehalose 6-phosphate phosphatase
MFEEMVKMIEERNGLTKVFLDYDGTLVNLTSEPELAVPSDSLLKILRELKSEIPICLITGRDIDGILSLVGSGFNIIALHGSQFYDENGGRWFIDGFENYVTRTGELVMKYSHLEKDFQGLRIIDKKGGLQFHYYNVERKERKRLEKLISNLHEEGFEIYHGKYVYELRIKGMNKGMAILRYINENDFVLFAGDDNTDEEAFSVLKQHITIKIGRGRTKARFRLQSPVQMKKFLSYLLANKGTMLRKVT